MKNKKFDCVAMKRKLQELLYKESGGDIHKLVLQSKKKAKDSILWNHFAKSSYINEVNKS